MKIVQNTVEEVKFLCKIAKEISSFNGIKTEINGGECLTIIQVVYRKNLQSYDLLVISRFLKFVYGLSAVLGLKRSIGYSPC